MTGPDALKAALWLMPVTLVACGKSLELPLAGERDAGPPFDAPVANAAPDAQTAADAGPGRDAGQLDATTRVVCGGGNVVTFHLQATSPDAGLLYATSGDPGDGVWWYSIAHADGTPVQLFLKTATRCDACMNRLIPIGFACSPVPEAGVTAAWDGTIVTGASSCLAPSPEPGEAGETIRCDVESCAPLGRYVVTMCAAPTCVYLRDDTAVDTSQSGCVSIPFDFPSTTEIVSTL